MIITRRGKPLDPNGREAALIKSKFINDNPRENIDPHVRTKAISALTLRLSGSNFVVKENGNVGVGTATPTAANGFNSGKMMQISSVLDSGLFLRRNDGATGVDIWGQASTGIVYIDQRYNGYGVYFRTNTDATPRSTIGILSNGNIEVYSGAMAFTNVVGVNLGSSNGAIFVSGGCLYFTSGAGFFKVQVA